MIKALYWDEQKHQGQTRFQVLKKKKLHNRKPNSAPIVLQSEVELLVEELVFKNLTTVQISLGLKDEGPMLTKLNT